MAANQSLEVLMRLCLECVQQLNDDQQQNAHPGTLKAEPVAAELQDQQLHGSPQGLKQVEMMDVSASLEPSSTSSSSSSTLIAGASSGIGGHLMTPEECGPDSLF